MHLVRRPALVFFELFHQDLLGTFRFIGLLLIFLFFLGWYQSLKFLVKLLILLFGFHGIFRGFRAVALVFLIFNFDIRLKFVKGFGRRILLLNFRLDSKALATT